MERGPTSLSVSEHSHLYIVSARLILGHFEKDANEEECELSCEKVEEVENLVHCVSFYHSRYK